MRLSPLASLVWLLALATSLAAAAGPARAGYIVTFSQVGPDVVASGSGSIDLDGLTFVTSGDTVPQVAPTFTTVATGAAGGIDEYQGTISGPSGFGPGVITNATTGTGDLVGLQVLGSGSNFVFVPTGYVSDAPLLDTATYAGHTFATLGLTPGVYVYSWGSGADADTFTVNIVPEPASLVLLGTAAVLGFVARRTRRSRTQSIDRLR